MAVVTEFYKTCSSGVILNRSYSDKGCYVVRDGIAYSEAIDPAECGRTYTEGVPIEEEVTAEEALAELVEVLQ